MSGYLSDEQVGQLLRQINPARVQRKDNASHLEAYDVRAMLIRIFGFGRFSADLTDLALLFETLHSNEKGDRVTVGYRATVRLTVSAPDGTVLATYTEAATGDASNFPISKRADAHDFAIKTAESQALKRCAVNLGDQFGISLYRKGSTHPLIMRTVATDCPAPAELGVDRDTPDIVPEHENEQHAEPEPAPESSVGVASPSPTESATPPPDQSTGSSPAAEVDLGVAVAGLREQVIEVLKERDRRKALQKLTKLQIAAAQQKLMEQPTHSPLGEPMTVAMLLDGAIKSLSRNAA